VLGLERKGKERGGEGRGDGGDTKVESWLAYGT
jgi:hypothetical protein